MFWYETELLSSGSRVSVNVKNADLEQVLRLVLKGQPLTYSILGKTIVVKKKALINVSADNSELQTPPPPVEIKGRVVDESGTPVSGVTVMVKGTTNGTQTNDKGEFVLTNVADNAVLEFTAVGHESKTVEVYEMPSKPN